MSTDLPRPSRQVFGAIRAPTAVERWACRLLSTPYVEDPSLSKAAEVNALRKSKPKWGQALSKPAEVPWPRVANLALGIWLQASAFAWPHTDDARLSAWLPGLLISVVALLAMSAPPMRWLNAMLAWLVIFWTYSSAATEPLTYLNGIVVGLLVLVLSTIPSKSAATDFRD